MVRNTRLGFLLAVGVMGFGTVRAFGVQGFESPPYQLVQFENSSYRDWTFEELSRAIGQDAEYLSSFVCDGRKEFEPYLPSIGTRPTRTSLMIQGSSSRVIYREGAVISPDEFSLPEAVQDDYLQAAVSALRELETLPSGRQLLRRLEEARFPITLKQGPNSFTPAEENGKPYHSIYMASALVYFKTLRKADDHLPFHQIGSGGIVNWDPRFSAQVTEEDGVMRRAPPHVGLAHELYHAFDANRGLLDLRLVQGESYEFTSASEYRAVHFENQIRQESGRRLRKYYGSQEGPDVLDPDGKPILIPSPCL